jgi:diguanylate cyclase (GGDEF)-like protein
MSGALTGFSDLAYDHLLCLAVLATSTLALLARAIVQERRHARKERGLEDAVRQRTDELDRERLREKAQNRVLEMLVSNQPLGTVLDAIATIARREIPECYCAILLRHTDGCRVAAAPGVPAPWLTALRAPYAIPFEVWKSPCSFRATELEPAWRVFAGILEASAGPAAVWSAPAGTDPTLGAVLILDTAGTREDPPGGTLEAVARLTQLAIEHSRIYDDLQFRAQHDVLTGLANRALFDERLGQCLHEAKVLGQCLAVVLVDIDRFKDINDTMSHRVGDLLLVEFADRMRRSVRAGDTVARIGGDEFSILLTGLNTMTEAEEIADRILTALRQPWTVDGRTLVATASGGLALFPDDGADPEDLKREADAAMYCAKAAGRDRMQSFRMRNEKLDRVRMEQELRVALRQGWFSVHYQPKIGANGSLEGLEALVRLNHPVLGQVPPAEFIPLAEESGLIVPLGAWILNEVCRQIANWEKRGFGSISVAVNTSAVQLVRPDFARHVKECLIRHSVPPSSLELELTESMLMSGGQESRLQMRELRELGIHFSIDDFGTGYSSLSYLHKLDVDAIKLDRSFVQSIDTDQAARRLVQAMVGVAEGLGLAVVAEGVETEAQRSVLIAAGCVVMQGYLFSKPLSVPELEKYLRRTASVTDDLVHLERATSARSNLEALVPTI